MEMTEIVVGSSFGENKGAMKDDIAFVGGAVMTVAGSLKKIERMEAVLVVG